MRLIPGATIQVHPSSLKPLKVAYDGRHRYIHATSILNVYCAITWRTCGYFKPSTGGSNRCHCRHNEYEKQESKKKKIAKFACVCIISLFTAFRMPRSLLLTHVVFLVFVFFFVEAILQHCMYDTHSEFGYICGTSLRVFKTNSSAASHIIHIRVLIFVLLPLSLSHPSTLSLYTCSMRKSVKKLCMRMYQSACRCYCCCCHNFYSHFLLRLLYHCFFPISNTYKIWAEQNDTDTRAIQAHERDAVSGIAQLFDVHRTVHTYILAIVLARALAYECIRFDFNNFFSTIPLLRVTFGVPFAHHGRGECSLSRLRYQGVCIGGYMAANVSCAAPVYGTLSSNTFKHLYATGTAMNNECVD